MNPESFASDTDVTHNELDRFDLYPTELLQEFLEQATIARDEIMDTISVIYAVLDERQGE